MLTADTLPAKKRGGQSGHSVHKSVLRKPDKIVTKYVAKAPTGAVQGIDSNGNTYYAVQEVDAVLKTVITETRYYVSEEGEQLPSEILSMVRIIPLIYSDNLKEHVLLLYAKGIIAMDRLSQMLECISNGALSIKPSTIV